MSDRKQRLFGRKRTAGSGLGDTVRHVLRLYVAGATVLSLRAVANITAVCEKYLGNRFDLQVIDVRQTPEQAGQVGIVATPTLVRLSPGPLRMLVGDLSDEERVLRGLDIRTKPM